VEHEPRYGAANASATSTVGSSEILERCALQFDLHRGDQDLLVDGRHLVVHELTPIGRIVIDELAHPQSVDALTASLAARFDAPLAQIAADVAPFVEELLRSNLVRLTSEPELIHPWDPYAHAISGLVRRDNTWLSIPTSLPPGPVIGPYRYLDLVFEVSSQDPEMLEVLAALLSPAAADAQNGQAQNGDAQNGALDNTEAVRAQHRVSVLRGADEDGPLWEVLLNDHLVGRLHTPGSTLRHLLAHLSHAAIRATPRNHMLHAAAVEINGVGVVLPGISGAGKSTLTAALVASGARLLSDEAVVVDPATGTARGLCRPLVAERLPDPAFPADADCVPENWRNLEAIIAAQNWSDITHEIRPTLLVCPRYVDGADAAVTPLEDANVFAALVSSSLAGATFDQSTLAMMDRLAGQLTGAVLVESDLGEAVRAVHELVSRSLP
jgi:hypothetical protein